MKPHPLLLLFLMSAATASAGIVSRSVPYQFEGRNYVGYLACTDSAGPNSKVPGILVIPEWWGVNDYVKSRADQLAAMGYVAFVADMYGDGINTTDAKKAKELAGALYGKPEMLARAKAGLDQLFISERADSRRLAAIGFCFGGAACQLLAYDGQSLDGIVCFHSGLVQPTPEQLKNVTCSFLILNGGMDPTVKPEAIANYLKALDSAHIDYQFINYAGALHAFTNPDATKLAEKNGLTATIGYNETAARRAWDQMQIFFKEILVNQIQ